MKEENKNIEENVTPVETQTPTPAAPAEPVEAAITVEPSPTEPVQAEPAAPSPEPVKKKGKGGLICILLLLLICGVFAAWYFALGGKDVLAGKKEEPKQEEKKEEKKDEEKEEEPKEKEEEKKEDAEPEKQEQVDYDGIVNDVLETDAMALATKIMDRYQSALNPSNCKSRFETLLNHKEVITPSSIDKKEYSEFIFNLFLEINPVEKISETGTQSESNTVISKYSLKKEDYIKYGKILFGKSFNAELVEEGNSGCIKFKYAPETESYQVIIPMGCGGLCSTKTFYEKLYDAKIDGDNLTVTFKLIYKKQNKREENGAMYVDDEYYADPELTNLLDSEDYSKGITYEVLFKKNGTAYSFVKSERKSS